MRLLVTGGGGFIGANFVHGCVREHPEDSVTVLDALTYAGSRESLAPVESDIRLVQGDITDGGLVDKLVGEADALLISPPKPTSTTRWPTPNCSCTATWWAPSPFWRPCAFTGCGCITCPPTRSMAIWTWHCAQRFTETTPYNPSSPYSSTKAAADLLVRAWVRSYGVAATISNCSNNYGPYQHVEKFIPRQITNVLTGRRPKLYGAGANVRDWIHVEDHNSAVFAILADGQIGRNLPHRCRGRTRQPDRAAHHPGPHGPRPRRLRPRHRPRRPRPPLRHRPVTALPRTRRRPKHTDFEEGLRATIDWYRANESWWAPLKDRVENTYEARGQ